MKKLILAAAAALMLCSCSQNDSSTSSSKSEMTTTTATQATAEPAQTDSLPEEKVYAELYDTTPISQAYLSGDDSALDDKQKAVLDAAADVIDLLIKDDMTPVEKELVIHDMIVRICRYDKDDHNALGGHGPNAEDPYGVLFEGKAICSGYTTTFKLFMEMLGIECINVHADSKNGEHAWSMVKLDGEWYYVDVTWDDASPDRGLDGAVRHKYFNVGADLLKETGHYWKPEDHPEADGTKYSYINLTVREVASLDELEQAFDELPGSEFEYIPGYGEPENRYFIIPDGEKYGLTEENVQKKTNFTGKSKEDGKELFDALAKIYKARGFTLASYRAVQTEKGIAAETTIVAKKD